MNEHRTKHVGLDVHQDTIAVAMADGAAGSALLGHDPEHPRGGPRTTP